MTLPFRKAVFWAHLIVGVAAGIVILVMSATGVLLMYERQITEWADRGCDGFTPARREVSLARRSPGRAKRDSIITAPRFVSTDSTTLNRQLQSRDLTDTTSADGNTGLSLSASTADLEPEKSRSFEVGTKWDLFNARLAMSTAVFQAEKVNARTPGTSPGDPAIALEGEQRIRGVEIGGSGRITDRWTAFFGYTWLDSEIVKSNTAVEVGNEFANTPEHSASLWTTYRLPLGFEIGGGFQYVADRLNSTTMRRVAPAYGLYDAMVSYAWSERLTLRLNVNNLTDERYIDRVGGGHFIPGAGRSVALTTSLDF